jgi:hypothetical protein
VISQIKGIYIIEIKEFSCNFIYMMKIFIETKKQIFLLFVGVFISAFSYYYIVIEDDLASKLGIQPITIQIPADSMAGVAGFKETKIIRGKKYFEKGVRFNIVLNLVHPYNDVLIDKIILKIVKQKIDLVPKNGFIDSPNGYKGTIIPDTYHVLIYDENYSAGYVAIKNTKIAKVESENILVNLDGENRIIQLSNNGDKSHQINFRLKNINDGLKKITIQFSGTTKAGGFIIESKEIFLF